MDILGQCHCGNLSIALAWNADPREIPARTCDCRFCRKHGAVWTANPAGVLKVRTRDAAQVSRYTFGTHTAVFHICMRCGVVPVVTSVIDHRLYAVVNVNTLAHIDAFVMRRASASFDGEGVASRLARRKREWIGEVQFC